MRLDVIVVAASSSRGDVRGNVRGDIGIAFSVHVGRSAVDCHGDVCRGVDGFRVVDDVGLDDGVGGDDGGDGGGDGFDDAISRFNGGLNVVLDSVSVDLDTLGVIGKLVGVAAGLGSSTLKGVLVGSSILGLGLAWNNARTGIKSHTSGVAAGVSAPATVEGMLRISSSVG